jgi:hypothetical protein
MNATPARSMRLLALSLALYRTLLLLYPARFRRAYATQMAQVFRTSCQRACREGGALALGHVWRVTLGDLFVTALAEHYEEVTEMERHSLNRAAGLAGLIGGALLLFYGLVEPLTLVIFRPWLYWAQILIVPVSWASIVVSMLGLYALLAQRHGARVWLAGALALLGACLGLIGGVSIALAQWESTLALDLATVHFDQIIGEPLPYLSAFDLYGRMLVGLALLLTPLLFQRGAALKFVTTIMAALGLMALVPYLYLTLAVPNYIRAFIPNYGVYPPLPRYPFTLPMPWFDHLGVVLVGVEAAFALIWGIGLLLLGIRFLRGWQPAAAQPTQPALGMSA